MPVIPISGDAVLNYMFSVPVEFAFIFGGFFVALSLFRL